MWPPQSVNTWPTPAPLSVRATSSPPVIQSEGRAPSQPPRLSSRQPPRFTDSPPPAGAPPPRRLPAPKAPSPSTPRPPAPAARLARPHPQTRLAARVAEPPRPPLGSHGHIHRLASAGGAPAPRRPAARTATHQNFSHLTDLRSRPLATRTSRTRWIIDSLPQT